MYVCIKAAAPPRAVVAPPLSGRRQRQRPIAKKFHDWLSQSNLSSKLPSISTMVHQGSVLPTAARIPRATKDDFAQPTVAGGPFMPEAEWPDFSKMKVAPDVENRFFNRNREYVMLMDYLNDVPSQPLLLLGRKNSGKSSKEKSRVLYLNCGIHDVSTPELMAQQLRTHARMLFSHMGTKAIKILAKTFKPASYLVVLLDDAEDTACPTAEILTACTSTFFPEDTLSAVIDSYNLILEESTSFWMKEPIIIGGVDDTQRKVHVLGYLTSAEAFVYVCGGKVSNRNGVEEDWSGLMARSQKTKELGMTPEDWKKVWSVSGGNMYMLQNCVASATRSNSWDEGVTETLSEPQYGVDNALKRPQTMYPPFGCTRPRFWEAKHYKAVLRLIATNPYHAVRQQDAEIAVEKVGIETETITADQVLQSMVEYSVLSLRPYSSMAQDIPREAFFKNEWGVEEVENVVTMPSPAHLAAALKLETKFPKEEEAYFAKIEEHFEQMSKRW